MAIISFPTFISDPGQLPRGGHITKMQVFIHPCFNDSLFVRLEPVQFDVPNGPGVSFGVLELELG